MTRLAVISDIHGNAVALDAALADIARDGVERVVCLGDAIQGGPQPAQVARRLRRLGCPVVMGNADAWLLSGVETGQEGADPERSRKMHEIREWSLARLSREDRDYISGFRATVRVALGRRRRLLAFHGSPASFDDLIFPHTPEEEFQRLLGAHAASVLCGGHTHLQQVRRIGDSFFFNPGSVGLAYRHGQEEAAFRADPWAEYAVLTANGDRVRLEFRRVPFDVDALLGAYRESGRPHLADAEALWSLRAVAPAAAGSGGQRL